MLSTHLAKLEHLLSWPTFNQVLFLAMIPLLLKYTN